MEMLHADGRQSRRRHEELTAPPAMIVQFLDRWNLPRAAAGDLATMIAAGGSGWTRETADRQGAARRHTLMTAIAGPLPRPKTRRVVAAPVGFFSKIVRQYQAQPGETFDTAMNRALEFLERQHLLVAPARIAHVQTLPLSAPAPTPAAGVVPGGVAHPQLMHDESPPGPADGDVVISFAAFDAAASPSSAAPTGEGNGNEEEDTVRRAAARGDMPTEVSVLPALLHSRSGPHLSRTTPEEGDGTR